MKLDIDIEMEEKIIYLVNDELSRKDISEKLGISKATLGRFMKKLNLFSKYRESKNVKVNCKECKIEFISNISADRKFCSKKCSATFNNKNREHSEETKNKIRNKLKKDDKKEYKKEYKKKIRYCKSCNLSILESRKSICDMCRTSYYKYYRPAAEFKFDIYIYKDRFNLELVDKHGWYSPKNKGNNLLGVSRDHMYSVKEGFINNIDPEILSSPANCRLLLHTENNKKKTESSITLEELMERIKNW